MIYDTLKELSDAFDMQQYNKWHKRHSEFFNNLETKLTKNAYNGNRTLTFTFGYLPTTDKYYIELWCKLNGFNEYYICSIEEKIYEVYDYNHAELKKEEYSKYEVTLWW